MTEPTRLAREVYLMTPRSGPGSTPLMRPYARITEQHRDAILFFRMGDFYETFQDDAPGVPVKAVDGYGRFRWP